MTKTVFSNDMVAHVWAQNSQSEGRSANGNFYFQGPTLYSYGSHFIVGHVMPDGTALLNADGYSISTAKHKTDARRAVRGNYIYVPGLTRLVGDVLRHAPRQQPKQAKDEIRTFVRDALKGDTGLSDDAAAYLLTLAGLPRSLAAVKREAEKARADETAKAAKKAKQAARDVLAEFTAESDHDYRLRMQRQLGDYNPADRLLERQAKDARSAMRLLSKAGTPVKVWKAAQARLATLPGLAPVLEANRGAHGNRVRTRQLIRSYRQATRNLVTACTQRLDPNCGRDESVIMRETAQALRDMASAAAYICNASRYFSERTKARALELTVPLDSIRATLWAELEAVITAERERSKAEREQREKAARQAWFAGESSVWHGRKESGAAYVRARNVERDGDGMIVGGTLETSQGAIVPLPHAIRAFRFVKQVRARGVAWQSNGKTIRVGHFAIDRIEPSGDFKAGCHRIEWPDVIALAESLGVAGMSADDSALVSSK